MSNSVRPYGQVYQVPLSMEFSRQEYWRELLCPSPGDLPNPGTEPRSLTLQAYVLLSEPPAISEKKLGHQFLTQIFQQIVPLARLIASV